MEKLKSLRKPGKKGSRRSKGGLASTLDEENHLLANFIARSSSKNVLLSRLPPKNKGK